MSDLSLQLQQAASQLPVSSYFDEALFQREMATIFQRGPRYVGHAISVPHVGDYYALPQENEGRALVRNANGKVELVSNICRHRQAIMLKGRGNLLEEGKGHAGGNIVCPLHRWTYSPGGELLGAPHFSHDPCLNLNNYPLQEWNGLLFEANGRDVHADLAGMQLKEQLARALGCTSMFVLTTRTMHWFIKRGFQPVDPEWLPEARKAKYNWSRKSQVLVKQL